MHQFADLLWVGNVDHFAGAALEELGLGGGCRDVPCHDYGVETAECQCEFRADLPRGADDKDVFDTSL